MSERIARSLSISSKHQAFYRQEGCVAYSWLARRNRIDPSQSKPAEGDSGLRVLFNGDLDNIPELAAELGCNGRTTDAAAIYALAIEAWGDRADRHCVGHYCAIAVSENGSEVRLSRSPIAAPPLHYSYDHKRCIAASVPRVLFAAGVEPRLNYERIKANLLFDECEPDTGWYVDTNQVCLGALVKLNRERKQDIGYYDPTAIPVVECTDDDALERVQALLDESAGKITSTYSRPGMLLSGGLDSPTGALALLGRLPAAMDLPTFTFVPADGWHEVPSSTRYGDERPMVEAFASMHSRIKPNFFSNEDVYFDHKFQELFLAMGCAPGCMTTFHTFHALWNSAREQGCDVIVSADMGNYTYSESALWAPAENLRRGHLRQLYYSLSDQPGDDHDILRGFLRAAVLPHLPDSLKLLIRRRVQGANHRSYAERFTAASPALIHDRQEQYRRNESFYRFEGFAPRDRHQAMVNWHSPNDGGYGDIRQGFSQIYGIGHRDLAAYRPLVEFCLSLPTAIFRRDGQTRRLARRLGQGKLPEQIVQNRKSGFWGADWQLKMGRRRDDLIAEIARLREDPKLCALIDFDKLNAALLDWPEGTSYDIDSYGPRLVAVTQAIVNCRFINYVEGSNQQ